MLPLGRPWFIHEIVKLDCLFVREVYFYLQVAALVFKHFDIVIFQGLDMAVGEAHRVHYFLLLGTRAFFNTRIVLLNNRI